MPENSEPSSRLPRVLLISPLPPPYGGIARWTHTMMEMDPHHLGVQLSLINTAHRQQRSDETSLAVRATTGVVQTLQVLRKFVMHLVAHSRPACVHVNTSGSLGLTRDTLILTLCRILRIHSVLHLRFGRAPEVLRGRGAESALLRWAIRLAKRTVSIDLRSRSAVTAAVGSGRSMLIPNFIDVASYQPQFERGSKTVLFLGSVSRSKGVGELLRAWNELALEDWKLYLAGPSSPTMKELVAKFRGDPSIKLLGPVEHSVAIDLMYDSAFMVLPSYTEGFPNVLLEGMATGTPIIASAVGAIPEMLEGGAGIVVPPKDINTLKEAIRHLAANSTSRNEMARNAHQRVDQDYSTDAVMAKYRRAWAR